MESQKILIIFGVFILIVSVHGGGDQWVQQKGLLNEEILREEEFYLPDCQLTARGHPIDVGAVPCTSGRCDKTKVVFHARRPSDSLCCCTDWPQDRDRHINN